MTRLPALARIAAIAACAVSLTACITLLPKTKPASLYRFGQTAAAAPAAKATAEAAPTSQDITVYHDSGLFQREAGGDRILTITAGKAAYVAETKWVAPASVLWDEAVAQAFDAAPGQVRLVSRGELAASDYVLRLDVRSFETDYDRPHAAPKVVVRVRAVLTPHSDRTKAIEKQFDAVVPARENRVRAIVDAYDRAVAKVLDGVVGWTEDQTKPS